MSRAGEVQVSGEQPTAGLAAILLANAALIGVVAAFGLLAETAPDLHYRASQEDEALEWASFWAFLGGAVVWAWVALRGWGRRPWPWFAGGLALFCFVVAFEEISWGQRLLGYRPPAYFLAENFQQELNLHNVVETSLRKLAVRIVVLGYGVVLPLVALVPPVGRALRALGVAVPPVWIVPGFAVAGGVYVAYPWKFTGEVVELAMGMGFAATGVAALGALRLPLLGLAAAGLVVLGAGTAALARQLGDDSPERLEAARQEAVALARDFRARARYDDNAATGCGLHRRVYTFVERNRGEFLRRGEFAGMADRIGEERTHFFLDVWNSPFWIRDKCGPKGYPRVSFVYSFGPNRRRDSTPWELRGDDVGVVILRRGEPPQESR